MVLDATLAGAASNSYLTVAEADALAGADLGEEPETWLAAPLDRKERALIRATRECDRYKGVVGERYSLTQALLFPRVSDIDGTAIVYLNPNIRLACYEQATYVLHNADILDRAATRRAHGIGSSQDDDGSWSIQGASRHYGMSQAAIDYLNAVVGYRPTLRSVAIGRPSAA